MSGLISSLKWWYSVQQHYLFCDLAYEVHPHIYGIIIHSDYFFLNAPMWILSPFTYSWHWHWLIQPIPVQYFFREKKEAVVCCTMWSAHPVDRDLWVLSQVGYYCFLIGKMQRDLWSHIALRRKCWLYTARYCTAVACYPPIRSL